MITYWCKKLYSGLLELSHNEEALLLLLLVVFAFVFGWLIL